MTVLLVGRPGTDMNSIGNRTIDQVQCDLRLLAVPFYATVSATVGVLGGDDVLAAVSQFLFVPNDRLKESLKGARSDTLIDRNRFGVLSLNARQEPANIA